MRRRRIGLGFGLSLLLCVPIGASAQSIGVFSDASASSCNIIWDTRESPFAEVFLHLLMGPLRNFAGLEFRVAGLPQMPIPPSTEFYPSPAVILGTSISDGLTVAWHTCQGENATAPVWLGKVTLISFNPVGEHTLAIQGSLTPSNPEFQCPLVNLCDPPAFTKVCVAGGQAFMNSSRDCTVAVDERSWSAVKQLYRE